MKKNYISILCLFAFMIIQGLILTVNAQVKNVIVQGYGQEKMVLRWDSYPGAASYYLETSTDGSNYTSVGTTADTSFVFTGLTPGTNYSFVIGAQDASNTELDEGIIQARTLTKKLVVDLPLNELVDGDKIMNTVTDSLDPKSNGQLTLVDSASSGLGRPVLQFLGQREPVSVSTYVRLWNTVQGYDTSMVGRTISLWFKNESPDRNSTLISFGKRSGMGLTIKNKRLYALSKQWYGQPDGSLFWVDSVSVPFSSSEWTHVTYVYDFPFTRLYLNGLLAAETTDGIGNSEHATGVELPWPAFYEFNPPSSTTGASAEIGCQYDPGGAMVVLLGDTWDPGVHSGYAFNGMMSDIKMYNYAMSDEEITASVAPAPANVRVQATGPDKLILRWDEEEMATSYLVSRSTDNLTWEVMDTTDTDYFYADGLDEGTTYYFKVASMVMDAVGEAGEVEGTTLTKALVVDMPLDELIDGDKVQNVITDSTDVVSNGQASVVDAATSGLGIPAIKFLGEAPVPVATWIRLWNTVQGYDQAFTGRTISFWMKNESPDKKAVPLSFGKRAGNAIALKDGMLFGLTGSRNGDINNWWADSTGTEFNSSDWTNITYVFDFPKTRLYVNGILVDESDGIGKMEIAGEVVDTALLWPTAWEIDKPGDTSGKSAEIGCLDEPNAAMVAYLGDTWDAGAHTGYSFNGMMAQLKMYNYALSDDEITGLFAEYGVAVQNLRIAAYGPEDLTLKWDNVEGNTGYLVQKSQDGTTYEDVETLTANDTVIMITGLTEGTQYFFRVIPQGLEGVISGNEVSGSTLTAGMVLHYEFADPIDQGVKNSIDNTVDTEVKGNVTTGDIPASQTIMLDKQYAFAASTGEITFVPVLTPSVPAYVLLENTIDTACGSMNHRTVTFWVKNENPAGFSVPFSVDKRSGLTFAFKDNMLFAFTKFWEGGNGSNWYADSIGTAFSTNEWTHVAYTFNTPISKLYVNGEMVSESDGLFWNDLVKDYVELPNPSIWYNVPGEQKSASIGSQLDAGVGLVKYLGDNWDGGAKHPFAGSVSDLRIYNYGLTDQEIQGVMMENLVATTVALPGRQEISVYPNPATDMVYIRNAGNAQVTVLDNAGRIVLQRNLDNSGSLSVSSLSKGLYYIRISNDATTEIHKISIVR